jgi:hypothetical protein
MMTVLLILVIKMSCVMILLLLICHNLSTNLIFSSNPINCAEIRTFNPITSVHDDLKLFFSLNTLCYIEFDVLCNLNNLEEKLF